MIQIETTESWREYIHDGERFLKTALNGYSRRGRVFTPEIIYNIVAMSIEKNIMGYLMYHKSLPYNHTLRDLVEALDRVDPMGRELYERVVNMDRFQEICSIDYYHTQEPNEDDVQEFLAVGQEVREFVVKRLERLKK